MRGEQARAALVGLFLAALVWGAFAVPVILVYREIGSWPG